MRKVWAKASKSGAIFVLALATASAPVTGQVRTIDPNQAIDADLRRQATPAPTGPRYPAAEPTAPDTPRYPDAPQSTVPLSGQPPVAGTPQDGATRDQRSQSVAREGADAESAASQTFQKQELLNAAEGTFGKGAAGLAGILERTLKEQGQPNAYIAGREAAGAIVVGLRYGKGTMFHKIEGQQPVYWTGPSVGFDLGGDANKVFVLVYNLYDSEDLYRRFPAGEGRVYFVGGFAATYLRRGNIVLIPIRLGVGWRQGVNLGYMKFSHKSRWFPF
jgi:hypothetical protein